MTTKWDHYEERRGESRRDFAPDRRDDFEPLSACPICESETLETTWDGGYPTVVCDAPAAHETAGYVAYEPRPLSLAEIARRDGLIADLRAIQTLQNGGA